MVEIHREYLFRRYLARRTSAAYCFTCTVTLCSIALPLVLAYVSHSFWLKQNTFMAQPDVAFKHQALLHLTGSNIDTNILWSTSPQLNEQIFETQRLRSTSMMVTTEDSNGDGKVDVFEINFKVHLQPGDNILSASVILFFSYFLQELSWEVDSVAFLQMQTSILASELHVSGDLKLKQRTPFRGATMQLTPLLDLDAVHSIEQVLLHQLVPSYFARNESTQFQVDLPIWLGGSSDIFQIHLHVRVPQQSISYVPSVIEVVKVAWIQYLSLLVVATWLAKLLKEFVFQKQLLHTHMQMPHWKSTHEC